MTDSQDESAEVDRAAVLGSQAFAYAPDGLLFVDQQGRILAANSELA